MVGLVVGLVAGLVVGLVVGLYAGLAVDFATGLTLALTNTEEDLELDLTVGLTVALGLGDAAAMVFLMPTDRVISVLFCMECACWHELAQQTLGLRTTFILTGLACFAGFDYPN